jgi:flagellar assembly protein FliH
MQTSTRTSSARVISSAAIRGMGGASAWRFGELDSAPNYFAADESQDMDASAPALTTADVEAAHTRGFTEGLKAGFANAQAHYEAELAKKNDRLQAPIEAFCAQFQALDAAVAEGLMRMALDVARNVVRAELASNQDAVKAVLIEGLAAAGEAARGARVLLNPADLAHVKADSGSELAEFSLSFQADSSIQVGGCVIEAGNTHIDATLGKRWQQALARLGRTDSLDAESLA